MAFDWMAGGAQRLARDPRRMGGERPQQQRPMMPQGETPQARGFGGFAGGMRGGFGRGPLGGAPQDREQAPRPDWKGYAQGERQAWGDFLRGPQQQGQQGHGRRHMPHSPEDWKAFLGQRKQAFHDFRHPKAKQEPAAPTAAAPAPEPMAIAAAEPAPIAAPVPEAPAPEPVVPPAPELVPPGKLEQAPIVLPEIAPESLIADRLDEQELLQKYLAGGAGV